MRKIRGTRALKTLFYDGQIELFRFCRVTPFLLPPAAVAAAILYFKTRDPAFIKLALVLAGSDLALSYAAAKTMPLLRARVARWVAPEPEKPAQLAVGRRRNLPRPAA